MRRLLFVCTGNTDRSPMTVAFLRKLANDYSLHLEAHSAGTHVTVPGAPLTPQAKKALLAYNIVYNDHKATPLQKKMTEWADTIYVMTGEHYYHILWKYGIEAAEKVCILGARATLTSAEGPPLPLIYTGIADPAGGDKYVYEHCLRMIIRALWQMIL